MHDSVSVKQFISSTKSVCIVPNAAEPEMLACALALFYTLKDLGKNVNLIIDSLPEKLKFLVPSLADISLPKNIVIAIPKKAAAVSQIYYENSEEHIKIHLALSEGRLKKEDVLFYVSQPKPDAVITLGIADFHKALSGPLNSLGFLLGTPIINFDASLDNKHFGRYNFTQNACVSEAVIWFIDQLGAVLTEREAECLLAGLAMHYEYFTNSLTKPGVFDLVSRLIKHGANYPRITEQLSKASENELVFVRDLLANLRQDTLRQVLVAELEGSEFSEFGEQQAALAIEKIKTLGLRDNILAFWKSHDSEPAIKGFFYSPKAHLINRFSEQPETVIKNHWVFLQFAGHDMGAARSHFMNNLL